MMSSASTGAYGIKSDNNGNAATTATTTSMNTLNGMEAGRIGASMGAELRLAAETVPNSPHGRNTSTNAMKMNSTTSVSLGNSNVMPNKETVPRAIHMAFSSAMIKAATYAPGIDPIPPTTTITNASPITLRSSVRLAGKRGICTAPPSAARNAPSANTAVNSQA